MGITLFFGGTFNPPHIAHRKMLEAVSGLQEIDRILVAPTNIPPHKEVPGMFASKDERLFMCKLLCDGVDKAEISDIEFKRQGKSYSFYTLSELKKQYGEIAMLIGGDMVTSFTTWHRFEELLRIAIFYVVRRKGIDNEEFDRSVEHLKSLGGRIRVLEIDFPEVSSTEVRNSASSGGNVDDLIPKNIFKYITDNGLYRKGNMTAEDYKLLLKDRLKEKRYYHSLCVADEAKRLAVKYGADPEKMYLAGLLHDITKNFSDDEQLQTFRKFDIMLSCTEKASPLIWHAMTGALVVEKELGITDFDIISSIRYHTTGKADMTLSQKIVFVADLTSADRSYPDIEAIRTKADRDLDECIIGILKFTICDIISKNNPLHPDTLDAYNYLITKGKRG